MPFCGQTETQMNSYKRWNNIIGWIVFAIAAMTYLLTMEPSSSLWDCSEFIATSYKLEVGHPPGAPLFMLLARLATILAPSTYYVPHMVNAMNCLASAFCILFLFWTITHLARRILTRQGAELTKANIVAVLGTGAVGALAYTFTDTFWFSAVEGEVYALSSMFTALVVWLMLKWEEQADQPHSMRWIVLIAYLMGLSIGVHILNLLCIPALVFIYYFRKTATVTWRGIALSTLVSGAMIVFVNNIIIPYTVYVGALVDLFFVNALGLPVNSGIVLFALALILGWAEQLEQDTALPAAARQKACGIRTQSEKLRALIEDLNLTSKLQYGAQPLRCRPTQAGPLLRRLAAEFCDSPLAARCTVALEIAPDADKAILEADAALLARAVENLLHNAACHNPGPVQVQLSAVRTGKTLRITIADDGAGYPPAVLHALQTDEAGENTPHILGLHVVEQIIRAHGGTAAFARNAPRGAKAVLVLPVTEDPAAR